MPHTVVVGETLKLIVPVGDTEPVRETLEQAEDVELTQVVPLTVEVGESVGDREGDRLSVGLTVTVPDTDPQADREAVTEAEGQREGLAVVLRVSGAERDTEGLADTDTVTVTVAQFVEERLGVGDWEGVPLKLGLALGQWDTVEVTLEVRQAEEVTEAQALPLPVRDALGEPLPVRLTVAEPQELGLSEPVVDTVGLEVRELELLGLGDCVLDPHTVTLTEFVELTEGEEDCEAVGVPLEEIEVLALGQRVPVAVEQRLGVAEGQRLVVGLKVPEGEPLMV